MRGKIGDRQRLEHILEAALDGVSFLAGFTYDDFIADRKSILASVRAIEIVGEAANHVTDALKAAHPEVDWVSAVGMRNFVVHQYFRVDLDAVWQTVKGDLPLLIEQIRAILATLPS